MDPFGAVVAMVFGHLGDVSIGGGIECGVDVRYLDVGSLRRWSQVHVDGHDHSRRNDSDVLHVAFGEIEDSVHPGHVVGAVRDGEDGVLLIVRGLREDEVRIPVSACPAALAFGAEERRGLRGRHAEVELKCAAHLDRLRCGRTWMTDSA